MTTTVSRVIKARRESMCVLCMRPVRPGQQIGKTSRGWCHTSCIIERTPTMRFLNNGWGDVGAALYDVPDAELPAIEDALHGLAHNEPGRSAQVFTALAGMVRTEREMREDEVRSPHPQRPAS